MCSSDDAVRRILCETITTPSSMVCSIFIESLEVDVRPKTKLQDTPMLLLRCICSAAPEQDNPTVPMQSAKALDQSFRLASSTLQVVCVDEFQQPKELVYLQSCELLLLQFFPLNVFQIPAFVGRAMPLEPTVCHSDVANPDV